MSYYGLYAQRFDTTGTPQWASDVIVSDRFEFSEHECDAFPFSPFPKNPVLVPAPDGGAFVAWQPDVVVRAQRITATGEAAWGSRGRTIGFPPQSRTWMNAVPDDSGGMIVVWSGYDSTFAQHIDADGTLLWGDSTSAVAIGPAMNELKQPTVAQDDSGGVIVAWTDHRNSFAFPGNIYAQRIDALGRVRWAAGGITVGASPQAWSYLNPVIVADGHGGAVIAWSDSRFSSRYRQYGSQVYGQRISRTGAALWAADGVVLSGAPDSVSDCAIGTDGRGGAILAWTRWVDDYAQQIWAQHIDSGGAPDWGESGRMVAGTAPMRRFPQVISDGQGGAIIAWQTSASIEAQHIGSTGEDLTEDSPGAVGSLVAMPNPTRDNTMLRLAILRSGHATVTIHDLVGRRVRALFEGDLEAGERWIVWDGRDDSGNRVRPGVYFARVMHPGTRAIGRIVLLP